MSVLAKFKGFVVVAIASGLLLSGCDQFSEEDRSSKIAAPVASQQKKVSERVSQPVEKAKAVAVEDSKKPLTKSLDLFYDKTPVGLSAETKPLTESRQGVKMGDVFAPADQASTRLSGKVLTKEGDEIPLENSVDGVSFGFETKM